MMFGVAWAAVALVGITPATGEADEKRAGGARAHSEPGGESALWVDRPLARIELEGLRRTRPIVVLRELSCREGDILEWRRLERDRLRLLDLNIFADVRLAARRDSTLDRPVLRVTVKETPTFIAYPVIEYTPEDRFSYGAYAATINLRGMNQGAGGMYVTGGRSATRFWLSTPWIMGRRLGAAVEGYWTRSRNLTEKLTERHEGAVASLGPSLGPHAAFPFTLGLERVRARRSGASVEGGEVRWEAHRWMEQAAWRDTREFRARPREGTRLGASVAAHGGLLGGGVDFERYGLDLLRVFPIGRDGAFTAASRVNLSRGTVPRYLRLGLGGATTLRGWGEGEFGGESRWYGWCEQRFPLLPPRTIPIWRKYSFSFVLDGALFLDGGSIWEGDALETGRARARWGAGVGLRLLAPIFRLFNLDVATNGRKVEAHALAGLRL